MNDKVTDGQNHVLVLEYTLDAPVETVWRAISIPELREKWLPKGELAAEPLSSVPDREVRYRMRDDEPPFLESIVTFQITPCEPGRTLLRIIHRLDDQRLEGYSPRAANDSISDLMRAA